MSINLSSGRCGQQMTSLRSWAAERRSPERVACPELHRLERPGIQMCRTEATSTAGSTAPLWRPTRQNRWRPP